MKIFLCCLCGSHTDEQFAKVKKAKKGWHFCAKDGWVKDDVVAEFKPLPNEKKAFGEPIPAIYLNRGRK
jgi:hypothetical protein